MIVYCYKKPNLSDKQCCAQKKPFILLLKYQFTTFRKENTFRKNSSLCDRDTPFFTAAQLSQARPKSKICRSGPLIEMNRFCRVCVDILLRTRVFIRLIAENPHSQSTELVGSTRPRDASLAKFGWGSRKPSLLASAACGSFSRRC